MSYPVIEHGDDERALIEYLTDVWAGVDLPYAPAEVSTKIPGTLVDSTHVQVRHETTAVDMYPFREAGQIRVTCWAPSEWRTRVKALGSRTQGLVCAMPWDVPGAGQGITGLSLLIGRSDVSQDPDTKNLAVWFLIRATLRGRQIAT